MKLSKWIVSLLILSSSGHNVYADQKAKCHSFHAEGESTICTLKMRLN